MVHCSPPSVAMLEFAQTCPLLRLSSSLCLTMVEILRRRSTGEAQKSRRGALTGFQMLEELVDGHACTCYHTCRRALLLYILHMGDLRCTWPFWICKSRTLC